VGTRYNPPPGWPPPPPGFTPKPGWQPDPSWPPPPPGWQLWVDDDEPASPDWAGAQAPPADQWAGQPAMPPPPGTGTGPGWAAEPAAGGRGRRAGRGPRKARRGLAIGCLGLVAVIVVIIVVVSLTGHATRQSSTGKITHRGSLDVFALTTGDCFDNPTDTSDIENVTAIPCTQAHDSQVFAKFDLSGADSSYPAQATLNKLADDGCNSRTGSIDKAKVTNDMTIRVLFPEQDAWNDGQRTVSCLIVNPKRTLTSSLLTSGT
jgi:Septum formation